MRRAAAGGCCRKYVFCSLVQALLPRDALPPRSNRFDSKMKNKSEKAFRFGTEDLCLVSKDLSDIELMIITVFRFIF